MPTNRRPSDAAWADLENLENAALEMRWLAGYIKRRGGLSMLEFCKKLDPPANNKWAERRFRDKDSDEADVVAFCRALGFDDPEMVARVLRDRDDRPTMSSDDLRRITILALNELPFLGSQAIISQVDRTAESWLGRRSLLRRAFLAHIDASVESLRAALMEEITGMPSDVQDQFAAAKDRTRAMKELTPRQRRGVRELDRAISVYNATEETSHSNA